MNLRHDDLIVVKNGKDASADWVIARVMDIDKSNQTALACSLYPCANIAVSFEDIMSVPHHIVMLAIVRSVARGYETSATADNIMGILRTYAALWSDYPKITQNTDTVVSWSPSEQTFTLTTPYGRIVSTGIRHEETKTPYKDNY